MSFHLKYNQQIVYLNRSSIDDDENIEVFELDFDAGVGVFEGLSFDDFFLMKNPAEFCWQAGCFGEFRDVLEEEMTDEAFWDIADRAAAALCWALVAIVLVWLNV